MNKLIFILSFFVFSFIHASEKEMIHDLEVIRHAVETKYAPKRWKMELFGWSLEKSFLKAKADVKKAKTVTDFQKIVKNLLFSTKDYHVGVLFYSTGNSWFPLVVKEVGGRYYVTNDTARLPEDYIENKIDVSEHENVKELLDGIQAGDEVIAIDGTPIRQAVEEMIDEYRGGDRTPTGYSLATRMLFNRRSAMPDTFTLTVLKDGEPVEHVLRWAKIPEWIKDHAIGAKPPAFFDDDCSLQRGHRPQNNSNTFRRLFKKDYSVEFVKPLLFNDEETEETDGKENRKKGFLPPLGEIIWETESKNQLYAYLYENESGKKIGYLYIPSYTLVPLMKELIAAIEYLEKESDALVIDQTNNPGGYLHFTYALISLLTHQPLAGLRQRETLIQEDMMDYAQAAMRIPKMLEKPEQKDELPNIEGYVITQEVVDQLERRVKKMFERYGIAAKGHRSAPHVWDGYDLSSPESELYQADSSID